MGVGPGSGSNGLSEWVGFCMDSNVFNNKTDWVRLGLFVKRVGSGETFSVPFGLNPRVLYSLG